MSVLERLSDATKALAEVSSASEAWELARTAEAARRYAQMKGLGTEAVNYATSIKAKAMILLADFIDAGQADKTIRRPGNPIVVGNNNSLSLSEVLETDTEQQARDAVYQARRLRDSLRQTGQSVDALIAEANADGEDLGIKGLRIAAWGHVHPEAVPRPISPPAGKYSCLVVDPPWPMRKIVRNARTDQGRTLDYPTMSPEQIADDQWVPVRALAADDCHLYLWVTHRYLPLGLSLAEQWGFEYQCLMTWRKNVGFTPYSWMYDTEHVIFARRGSLALTELGLRLSFDAPVNGHSVKPDVFYERVIAASPGPRLEMFARHDRDGFDAWGNEVGDVVSG